MQIKITVQNKIARLNDPQAMIVCGNSDYVISFSFDEEWAAYRAKTARFTYNGGFTDVVFEGEECAVPVLRNTDVVFVGVYAGDLHTTTPAFINCEKSILCRNGAPHPPTEDVYTQLMTMINGGMLKGEQGEKGEKGDKGDAGAIKFIPVAELPTESIDDSAVYLLPAEGGEGENRFTEYVYINGNWEVIGAITVQVDHSEYVKKTDYATEQKVGVVRADKNYGIVLSTGGLLLLSPADNNNIDKRTYLKPIDAGNLDYAVLAALTTNRLTMTEEQLKAFYAWIGAVQYYYENRNGIARFINGQLIVNTPTEGAHVTTKNYVDGKFVAKETEATTDGNLLGRLYGVDKDGNQVIFPMVEKLRASAIPIRDALGQIAVGTPHNGEAATPKTYVDSKYAELLARIEALEAKS